MASPVKWYKVTNSYVGIRQSSNYYKKDVLVTFDLGIAFKKWLSETSSSLTLTEVEGMRCTVTYLNEYVVIEGSETEELNAILSYCHWHHDDGNKRMKATLVDAVGRLSIDGVRLLLPMVDVTSTSTFHIPPLIRAVSSALIDTDAPKAIAIIDLLVKAGADINTVSRSGGTAAHYVEHLDVAKHLVAYGIDLTIKNASGNYADSDLTRCDPAVLHYLSTLIPR